MAIEPKSPIHKSEGAKQNIYGTINAQIPSLQAVKPTSIGLAPDMVAAAYAAIATGGVIAEIQAK